jgi:hypothetical protein
MQNSPKKLKVVAWILAILAGLFVIALVVIDLGIGWGVKSYSEKAIATFGGDRVEALIAQVECETCNLDDRNHAVWTLGQLKDKRALPALYKYYTGEPCNHMQQICQYELSKAIKWTEGNSFTFPRLWRPFL